MKLKIEKKIEGGIYKVEIVASAFSAEEIKKMSTFGSPNISVMPESAWHAGNYVSAVPVHALGHTFQFGTEDQADNFVVNMRSRIATAMSELRSKTDKFTEKK